MGLLGTKLDRGYGPERWMHWRPTVSLFQHEELLWDRYELLYEVEEEALVKRVVADIRQVSPETEVRLHRVSFGKDPWDLAAVYGELYDWCRRYSFDMEGEEYLVHITTGTHVAQISWFLLCEAAWVPGRLIQTSPPRLERRGRGHLPGNYAVIDLDLSKYDILSTRFQKDQDEVADYLKSGIPTRSEPFNRMIERMEQVALRSRAPILLTGPTGAGKSQLAKRIYELRRSRGKVKGSLVEVNCATLKGDTAASALFGHVRGAYTGAQRDRPGLLREADEGLLFLDEIGELGLDEQAMLLRALEEGVFLPVGADQAVRSDFQLIAGTNRDLRREVGAGRFREDLFARIQLWTFALPSLAERREDLEPNLDYELRRFSEVEGRKVTMNKEARQAFLRFGEDPGALWSGNFRDLNAAVMRMGTLAPRGRIRVEEVKEEEERLRRSWERPGEVGERKLEVELERWLGAEVLERLDPFDRVQLEYVVGVCVESRSLSEAGRRIFEKSRKERKVANDSDRLRKYLAKYGLEFDVLAG